MNEFAEQKSRGHNLRYGIENLSSSFSDEAQEPVIKQSRKSGRGQGLDRCQGCGSYIQDMGARTLGQEGHLPPLDFEYIHAQLIF